MRTVVLRTLTGVSSRSPNGLYRGLYKATPIVSVSKMRYFASDSKSKAYEELLKTYSALADDKDACSPASPMVKPPTTYLKEKMAQPMAQLTIDELDAIAAACFTGDQSEAEDPIPRDVDKAISIWSETATKGSVMGLYQMGALQYEGVHMDKNDANAMDIFEQLVEEHGHPMSKYMLGVMFSKGDGCEKCDLTAFEYFKQAAGDGILPAFHNVANYYMSGIKRNPDHVDKTVGGGGDRGSGGGGGATGPAERGGVNNVTVGVPRDFNAALKYYEFGANHGDPHSCLLLAHWYSMGFTGVQSQLDDDEADAAAVSAVSAVTGGTLETDGDNAHQLREHEIKISVEQDMPRAISYYNSAVQIGHPIAAFNLGVWYMSGITSTGDVVGDSAAVDVNKALADEPGAVSGEGAVASTGEVLIKPDVKRAVELFDRSSRQGYPQATMNLGQIYRHGYKDHSGNVIEKDLDKAIEVFSRHAGGVDATGQTVAGFPPVVEQLKECLASKEKAGM